MHLSARERHLLLWMRHVCRFGELVVRVQDGEPVTVERAVVTVKLGGPELRELEEEGV